MKNDSVREELELSLSPIATPVKFRFADEPVKPKPVAIEPVRSVEPKPTAVEPVLRAEPAPPGVATAPPPVERRVKTSDLTTKKTSPTLAAFKNDKAPIPEWRLQLQNSIRQRNGRSPVIAEAPAVRPATTTSGANALKVQYEPEPVIETDERVANALRRIEQSRRTYLPGEKARQGIRVAKEAAAQRNYPFNVVARSGGVSERVTPPVEKSVTVTEPASVRPKLISSLKIEKKRYDTNKLVPIPEAETMAPKLVEKAEGESIPAARENLSHRIEIKIAGPAEDFPAAIEEPLIEEAQGDPDEIDDLAPIAMRFNSGLFDLIIGAFATFILVLPLFAFSEGWMSFSGLLLFASVLFVVMFVYLTLAVTFLGQTFGMKLFSLELVDAEQSEFPTLHQAAVNSSVYLLSLIFGGLGFVPIFFNEEKRAAHDLVSGTILVREV
ncbi:MAG TPA: RDD family protein [Pyrinomonadaceae bacterium]|nr:RDD family protein [Pyrinomonadaceae bacterium]